MKISYSCRAAHWFARLEFFTYTKIVNKNQLKTSAIPDAPGVYFFLGSRQEILYIGKATSLRNRVRSYFTKDLKEKRSELIDAMVEKAKKVEWTVTDSVLEALIVETNLIRTHKPRYNTLSKDDKSYNHLVITNEEWPRVLVVRGKDITEKFSASEIKYDFGPFPSGNLFREALKIVRKLFRFYDTAKPIGEEKSKITRGKIDFNTQIGLYPNHTDKKKYQKTIRHIKLFFEGKKEKIIAELEAEMMQSAKNEEFEEANTIKKKIFALKHIQDIALIKEDTRVFRGENNIRIEAFDVAHLQGTYMVGVMTVLNGSEPSKSEYRKFKISSYQKANDPGALREILERRFSHPEWSFPQLIVVDGSTAQKNVALHTLRKYGLTIPVVAVVKNERHAPDRILGPNKLIERYKQAILFANAEAHRFSIQFFRERQRKGNLK